MERIEQDQVLGRNITSTKRLTDAGVEIGSEELRDEGVLPKSRAIDRRMHRIDQRKLIPRETEVIVEKVKLEQKPQSNEVHSILQSLNKHFALRNLTSQQLENISERMFYASAEKDQIIFKQGDDASCFFIIEKGRVEVSINNIPRKELGSGEGFGDLALLYNAPRSATIKALELTYVYGIDRATFKRVIEEMMTLQFEENRRFINEIKFFNIMTEDQKDALVSTMISLTFKKDENILNEGDLASSFYIVQDGTVAILKDGKEIRQMGKGATFGEQALYYNTVRSATVKALTECKCISLSRETFIKTLGSHIEVITLRNQQIWAFEKSPTLSKLNRVQIEKIADRLKIRNHKKGDILYKKGDLLSSKVVVMHQGSLTIGGKPFVPSHGVIGDEGLLNELKANERTEHDIVFESDEAMISEIHTEDFLAIIGGPLKEVLIKNQKSHEKK